MRNTIMIVIVLVSFGSSFYAYSKLKGESQKDKKELLALLIGQLIPLFALIFPQEGTKILFPEMEKKIEENKKLQSEITKKIN